MNELRNYDLLATAVLLVDSIGQVAHANVAAQELLGQSARQLAGASAALLFHDAGLQARFDHAIRGRYGVLRQDTILRDAQGSQVDLTIVPIETPDWIAVLELRGIDQHGSLERTHQLARELEAQRESLRNLAHEVKNPLGGIRGAAQLLDTELPSAALREYTGVIMAEADRLTALVDRLIAPQGNTLNAERFNIHEVCERVYTLMHAEFSPAISIVRDYDASVPDLQGDLSRLLQALLNIARNAAQALVENPQTERGALLLRTRIGRQRVLAGAPVKLSVVVSVIDNGPGVPATLRDKVFHPLVTGRASGTGLGLSLAQEFAQQHGGAVEFDSEPGQTEFRLILPLEIA